MSDPRQLMNQVSSANPLFPHCSSFRYTDRFAPGDCSNSKALSTKMPTPPGLIALLQCSKQCIWTVCWLDLHLDHPDSTNGKTHSTEQEHHGLLNHNSSNEHWKRINDLRHLDLNVVNLSRTRDKKRKRTEYDGTVWRAWLPSIVQKYYYKN